MFTFRKAAETIVAVRETGVAPLRSIDEAQTRLLGMLSSGVDKILTRLKHVNLEPKAVSAGLEESSRGISGFKALCLSRP